MSNLNLSKLKSHRSEILKAEIGTLLYNLGKTHAGINKWGSYFPNAQVKFNDYRNYYSESKNKGNNIQSYFKEELTGVSKELSDFVFGKEVKLPDNSKHDWKEFFYGAVPKSKKDFIKEIFFRGCENINSGIDKGSPKDENQLSKLWISNAFGTYKKSVDINNFDKSRLCFFQSLHRFLEDGHYYLNHNWEEIRDMILSEIKPWYSRLLSDSRFPVNDVTLWDQAYMTASMFKAVLSSLYLDNSNVKKYIDSPQSIKWSILGIQYDKLGLAEKGLKAASIKWYRDNSKQIDVEIKNLIETEYPIGNEVYRDETGIYFVVGDNLIGAKSGDFYKLHDDLGEIRNRIIEKFSERFEGEVYPAILLTAPSRGLMNLGALVRKAKENFLKAEIPENFNKYLEDDSNPNGICQICGMRLASKENKENLICDVCSRRLKGRINNWIKNPQYETIWLDELQDKNGRVALITLKFELNEWLNGDLVNSLLVREENYGTNKSIVNDILRLIKEILACDEISKLSILFTTNNKEKKCFDFVGLFDRKAIYSPFEGIKSKLKKNKSISNVKEDNGMRSLATTLLKSEEWMKDFAFFEKQNGKAVVYEKRGNKNKTVQFQSYDQKPGYRDHLHEIFAVNYLRMLIGFILLEYSVGSRWGEFILKQLNDWDKFNKRPLNNKINFEERKIYWEKLGNKDIEFLANIILQFLLRKNPSPARIRRIWETTKEFLEDLESRLVELIGLPDWRKKRILIAFENGVRDINGNEYPDGEYKFGNLLFWKNGNEIRMITSIEKMIDTFKGKKDVKELITKDNKSELKDLFENEIKELTSTENSKEIIEIDSKKRYSLVIEDYKPYFTIVDPTPVSWQFIIPAENVPDLLKSVQEEYYKNFRWVYGKLPLHVGIVVQNYKSPLYVGVKALRNIRRDGIEWNNLKEEISVKDFKARQKVAFNYQQSPEQASKCEDFYSLFEKKSGTGKYEFYLYPDVNGKRWLDTVQNSRDTEMLITYPNTFDFEFLDTNTRRNDIIYNKNGKRVVALKGERPYNLEMWKDFESFKNYFEEQKSSSKLQKLISLIYSKIEDWKDNSSSIKSFMLSAFINILELGCKGVRDDFALKVMGVNNFKELESMGSEEFKNRLIRFIDMFEFWHTTLKQL